MTSVPSLLKRNSVFRDFLWASSISLLGSSIFDIAMPLYVLDRTHSVVALSLVNVALNLPYFLMAPLTGYTVDNFNKRRVMLSSDIGQVLCMIALLAHPLMPNEALWPILIFAFLAKSCMTLFETVATFQLVPALVSRDDLTEANTWFLSSQRVLQVVGPLAGGLLMSVVGIRSAIAVNTLSFGATLYFVFRLKNLNELIEKELGPAPGQPVSLRNVVTNFTESLQFIWESPIFKPLIFVLFLWNLSSLVPNSSSFTYYFTEVQHFSSAQYGMVVAFFGFMAAIGLFGSNGIYRRYSFLQAFSGSCFWQAVFATICLALPRQPVAVAIIFGVSRICSAPLSMGTFVIRQTEVPRDKIGGVNAAIRMLFMSAIPVSAALQAFLIDHFGVNPSFVVGGMCLWGTWWYSRKVGLAFDDRQFKESLSEKQAA